MGRQLNLVKWLLATLAVSTIALNARPLSRLFESGYRMATSWSGRYRSNGDYIDVARRMAECAQRQKRSIAYCRSYADRLTSVDRSRILAMSWVTAPCPVRCGVVQALRGVDAVVVSQYAVGVETESRLGSDYREVSSEEGVSLWTKCPSWRMDCEDLEWGVDLRSIVCLTVLTCAIVILLIAGGCNGLVFGMLIASICVFFQVVVIHRVGSVGAVVALLLAAVSSYMCQRLLSRKNGLGELQCRVRVVYDGRVSAIVCLILLVAYSSLSLTHTFVSPNGLGTIGGKAKLMFLAKGFPNGFFTNALFSLYQPAYPPGAALFTLIGYMASGVCDEWLVQVVPCTLTVIAAGILLSRTFFFQANLLIIAFFLSPLTFRLATLFYPEVYVCLCVLVGWERIRAFRCDGFGWILIGASGWFKNEGLVYFAAIAFAVLLSSPLRMWSAIAAKICCAAILPFAWHVGCRICGASLDGYLPIQAASVSRGWMALCRISSYALKAPWRYAFAFPCALLVGATTGFRSLPLRIVVVAAVLSVACLCVVFSLSCEVDFAWHLDSAERLLWTPALLLMRETFSGEVFKENQETKKESK